MPFSHVAVVFVEIYLTVLERDLEMIVAVFSGCANAEGGLSRLINKAATCIKKEKIRS